MPQPLDVDREQVRMLVLSVGVREAARKIGISEDTVAAWSARYEWLKPLREKPLLPKSMQPKPLASDASKPADALQAHMQEHNGRTRSALAVAATKGSERIAEMDADEILTQTQALRDITSVAKDVHQWSAGDSNGGALVQIAVLGSAQVVERTE